MNYVLEDFYVPQKGSVKPIEYVKDGDCFICVSHAKSGNYFKIGRNGKAVDLHVWINEVYNGECPKGMVVRHLCNNSKCINPKHLKVGTYKENTADTIEAGNFSNSRVSRDKPEWFEKFIDKSEFRIVGDEGTSWCGTCKKFLPNDNFSKRASRWNGLDYRCKKCKKEYR